MKTRTSAEKFVHGTKNPHFRRERLSGRLGTRSAPRRLGLSTQARHIMDQDDRGKADAPKDLKRRGDNVGQSGRWTRDEDKTKRYGNEERWHSTDHADAPQQGEQREPNADKPRGGPYEGGYAPPEQGQEKGDDKSRFRSGSYADPGGETGKETPVAPGETRWRDERAAGHDKDYGRGSEIADDKD
jgi:hypothetical protein